MQATEQSLAGLGRLCELEPGHRLDDAERRAGFDAASTLYCLLSGRCALALEVAVDGASARRVIPIAELRNGRFFNEAALAGQWQDEEPMVCTALVASYFLAISPEELALLQQRDPLAHGALLQAVLRSLLKTRLRSTTQFLLERLETQL
jgi:hypothetical protein